MVSLIFLHINKADVYSPATGEVKENNKDVIIDISLINNSKIIFY